MRQCRFCTNELGEQCSTVRCEHPDKESLNFYTTRITTASATPDQKLFCHLTCVLMFLCMPALQRYSAAISAAEMELALAEGKQHKQSQTELN